MLIQSSCSKILLALKHHLCKGFSLVLCQCSNSGKGILHWVSFLGLFFLLPLSVFFSWAISCLMSCLPTFEAFSLLHQHLSFFKYQCVNVHCVEVFLLCWSVPAPACCLLVVLLVLAKNGCRFSVVHVKLDRLLEPVVDCPRNYLTKHDLVCKEVVQGFRNSPIKWMLSEVDLVVNPACPINCLNSVMICLAVFLPCFRFSNLHSASWTRSADWNALCTSVKKAPKVGYAIFSVAGSLMLLR